MNQWATLKLMSGANRIKTAEPRSKMTHILDKLPRHKHDVEKSSWSHLSNWRSTVREVADEAGIAKTTCHEILTKKLVMQLL
jgi:predicted DNA binding protein